MATPPMSLVAGTPQAPATAPGLLPPDPYADRALILETLKQFKSEALDNRWVFERVWWRNLLYVMDRQWIVYDRARGQWVDKRLAKWVPRPVTNKIRDGVDSLLSMFSAIQLAVSARPVGNDSKNVATAEIVDLLAPFVHAEHRMDQVLRLADLWNIICGNACLFPHWDKEAQDGEVVVPFERCASCNEVSSPKAIIDSNNACPKCGASTLAPAVGPDGAQIGESVPTGSGRTLALSPFEYAIPNIYADFDHIPGCLRLHWRPKRYYEAFYPELVKNLNFSSLPQDRSLQLLRSLATQTDMQAKSNVFGSGGEGKSEGIAEYELHLKPTKQFPEGLFVRAAGDGEPTILEGEGDKPQPLPYRTKQGKPLFTFCFLTYQPSPGRIVGRGAVDAGIQSQDKINQLDSMMQMTVQRVSNPIWLEPKGAETQSFSGEPGVVVKYNPLAAGGAKPERLAGENIPSSLFQLREQYVVDLEQHMGTYDVLKGTKPAGVEAFSALQLLVERGQSRFTTQFNIRGECYRKWFHLSLELERTYGPTERVIAVTRPNRGFSFRHFENAHLQGSVEIHVEDGSQIPKTSLGRRAAIEQANNLGLITPDDPEQKYAILGTLGLSDIMPSLDYNVKAALTQQDAFEEWANSQEAQSAMPALEQAVGQHAAAMQQFQMQAAPLQAAGLPAPAAPMLPQMTPLIREPWHKATVHIVEHEKWANSDKARELFLNFPVLKVFFTMHYQEDLTAMQAEAMAAMGPAPGAPGAGPGGGQAMAQSNRESGSTADVPSGTGEGSQNAGPR